MDSEDEVPTVATTRANDDEQEEATTGSEKVDVESGRDEEIAEEETKAVKEGKDEEGAEDESSVATAKANNKVTMEQRDHDAKHPMQAFFARQDEGEQDRETSSPRILRAPEPPTGQERSEAEVPPVAVGIPTDTVATNCSPSSDVAPVAVGVPAEAQDPSQPLCHSHQSAEQEVREPPPSKAKGYKELRIMVPNRLHCVIF